MRQGGGGGGIPSFLGGADHLLDKKKKKKKGSNAGMKEISPDPVPEGETMPPLNPKSRVQGKKKKRGGWRNGTKARGSGQSTINKGGEPGSQKALKGEEISRKIGFLLPRGKKPGSSDPLYPGEAEN